MHWWMMAIFAVTLLVCDQIFGNSKTWISLVPVTFSLTFSLLATYGYGYWSNPGFVDT